MDAVEKRETVDSQHDGGAPTGALTVTAPTPVAVATPTDQPTFANDASSDEEDDTKPPASGSARQHYIECGSSRRILFLLALGIENGDKQPIFNINIPPWTSMKRKSVKPNRFEYQDEVKRRAKVLKGFLNPPFTPRPKNWNASKCHEWLSENPIVLAHDVQFIKEEVFRVIELAKAEEKPLNRSGIVKPRSVDSTHAASVPVVPIMPRPPNPVAAAAATVNGFLGPAVAGRKRDRSDDPIDYESLTSVLAQIAETYKADCAMKQRMAVRRRMEELQDKAREYRRLNAEYHDKSSTVAKFYQEEAHRLALEVNELKQHLANN